MLSLAAEEGFLSSGTPPCICPCSLCQLLQLSYLCCFTEPGSLESINSEGLTTEHPQTVDYRAGLKIFVEVPGTVFFCFMVVTSILMFIALALMTHLYGFHIYLCKYKCFRLINILCSSTIHAVKMKMLFCYSGSSLWLAGVKCFI